jgi:SAM-dependent methyltransferase
VSDTVDEVYAQRFSDEDAARKDALWREIGAFLQRYVPEDGVVLDVACDRGDFVRNVRAREKWATDLRDVSAHLPASVRFVQANGLELDRHLPHDHFDVVFMSNYLEHLPDGDAVVQQLRVARTILRTGGRVVVLQPNVRLVGGAYWDFIDHSVALTEKSLVEAGELAGLRTTELVVRFLPYTTKSRLPQSPRLVRAYLRLPLAWRLLGKQTLYVGEK